MTQDTYIFRLRFTKWPGGRFRKDGPHSGEEFFEDVLVPKYQRHEKTVLDMTGVVGFAISFLDQSFGEFANKFTTAEFEKYFTLKVDDDPTLVERVQDSMRRAEKSK